MRRNLRWGWIWLITVILVGGFNLGTLAERSLVYFYSPSCGSCVQTKTMLSILQVYYPDLQVIEHNVLESEEQLLLEGYGEKYGLSQGELGIVPAIFYGEEVALVGLEPIRNRLEQVVATPKLTPKLMSLAVQEQEMEIIQRFKSFNVGTILVAGLIDGVNPCAFSTLIFFISFLVVTGQRGRKILYVGASFTSGIFISYLLMGWGIFRIVTELQALTRLARWVYPVTAVLVTGLAVVSLIDYGKVRGRQSSKMLLTLPKGVVRLINRVVHRLMKKRYLLTVSFVTGVLISFLEFLCTGQIYLPTIVYITGVEHLRSQSLLYLLLYNLSFILPMVVIFLIAYKTNTSRQVAEFLYSRLQGVKLLLVGVFTLLAVYMWVITFKFF